MADRPIWKDGALVAWTDATVSVLAHAMQRGSLVFDVLSFHATPKGPGVFRLREHVARFLRSAAIVGLEIPFEQGDLEAAARRTVAASGLAEGLVRIAGFFPNVEADLVPRDARGSVAIAAYGPSDVVPPGATAKKKPSAWRITIPSDVRKAGPEVFPPEAKVAAAYLGPMLARRRALAAGYDEIVLLDREGHVAEGPTDNVFAVVAGKLVTPPLGRILDGITRDAVLAIARAEGIAAEERPILPEELRAADEVFLTATSIPVGPVVAIDGTRVGSGEPGPITKRIAARLSRIEAGEDAAFAGWIALASG
jgi:branched-chain amino acid aminotransferase